MGETTNPASVPNTIILPGEDLVADFTSLTGGRVSQSDLHEIVTQIVQVLLNEENGDLEALSPLPDFNRMRDATLQQDAEYAERVRTATLDMGLAMHKRLREVGAYVDNDFSYFFGGFVGYDFIFHNIPY